MKKIRRTTKLAIRGETLRKLDDALLWNVAGAKSAAYCSYTEQNGVTCVPPETDHCN